MRGPLCRFPTLDGPCGRVVSHEADRCGEHAGLDAVGAARELATVVRARAAEHAALRGRQRTDATAHARADVAMSDAQIAGVAECLNRHEVDYVFVGGGAAQRHGAPVMRTRDADVVPSKSDANLDRLAAALREMEARVWVGPKEP